VGDPYHEPPLAVMLIFTLLLFFLLFAYMHNLQEKPFRSLLV